MWRELRALFTRMLVCNAARGRAAAGLAVVQGDGEALVYKLDIEADQFTQTDGYRDLLATVDDNTVLILGHTRLPTQGSPANLSNNHPIEAGDVIGVHNGHIANDDELFARWHLPRAAQVDSEIIFRRLAALSPLTDQYLSDVSESLSHLNGQYTFLAVDRRCPMQLLAFKHANPLCIHYQREWRALFFSSEYLFLRRVFGRSVSNQSLPRNQLVRFDALRLAETNELPVGALDLSPV